MFIMTNTFLKNILKTSNISVLSADVTQLIMIKENLHTMLTQILIGNMIIRVKCLFLSWKCRNKLYVFSFHSLKLEFLNFSVCSLYYLSINQM